MTGILVTGAGGLLGTALVRAGGLGLPRADLDITDADAVAAALDRLAPHAVVNAAAQAKVDLAETERDRTEQVNHLAVAGLARACRVRGIRLLHVGSDYSVLPAGHYAATKRRGEEAALAEGAVVVRVQWVYHPAHEGFLSRCLRALARGEELALVTDQVGCPTPADLLAPALLAAAHGGPTGAFALACTGEATPWAWIEAAATVVHLPFRARPIPRAALGGAPRPARSVLDSAAFTAAWGLSLPPWRDALHLALSGGPP
ncbi:NAD(P)-dependent oxidoreductase [Myxococcota bacterium]|nr:NAD(P)-dependent oxidoreductase [Myxococcota bacterium]